MLGGNGLEQVGSDALGDQVPQRPGVEEAFPFTADLENIDGANGGVGVAQGVIILWAKERKRCDQGAGTGSGHQCKFGTRAGLGPAI
jgi:hypothetical protein